MPDSKLTYTILHAFVEEHMQARIQASMYLHVEMNVYVNLFYYLSSRGLAMRDFIINRFSLGFSNIL